MRFKKGRKGFTLIELIVVLVILAVLAALLVPALTGYIDKAKEKSVVAEARMILQAVQTEVSEIYGTSDWKQIGNCESSRSSQPFRWNRQIYGRYSCYGKGKNLSIQ